MRVNEYRLHITMNEPHEHNVQCKRSDTAKYILNYSIYTLFKNRQNKSAYFKVKIVLLEGLWTSAWLIISIS